MADGLDELAKHLREVEEQLNGSITAAIFPNGRAEAYDRIDSFCSVHSLANLSNIDRSPHPYWKTKTF